MAFALKIFDVVFALSGDTAAVPDSPPGDGSVSYLSGYGVDYQLDLATDPSALPVGRQQFNQLLQDLSGAAQQVQQTGYTPWSALLKPYPQYAVVLYSDGHIYESAIATNNSTPGADANWVVIDLSASGGSIGFGQNWTDVTGSRSYGTTYHNTTALPILFVWSAFSSVDGADTGNVLVNGVDISRGVTWPTNSTSGHSTIGPFLVPPGQSYEIQASSGFSSIIWAELR